MAPTHGKAGTYRSSLYKCRCDACTAANTARSRRERDARAARPADEIPHGLGGYKNYRCRCEVCKAAQMVANARRKSRARLETAAAADAPATTAQTPNPSERN